MLLPDYWLQRPITQLDSTTQQQFDELYKAFSAHPQQQPIDYNLSAPKWQFLCYLAEQYQLALHGSGNPFLGQIRGHDDARLADYAKAMQTGSPLPD